MTFAFDQLVFTPDDVDLSRSPLRRSLQAETFVLGAFNPGLARLPNGNLLMMVRVAEALKEPVVAGRVQAIRWAEGGYRLESWPLSAVDMADPRQFDIKGHKPRQLGLTSLSWLLPVELSPDGQTVLEVRYEEAVEPVAAYQEYGVEDPRISLIDGRYWMTTCSVSSERLGTSVYTSDDGRSWRLEGLVLDHLNKDMLYFEGRPGGRFMALTRPLGEVYFAFPEHSEFTGGPSINLAASPDGLHWKPVEDWSIRGRKGTRASKVGGGTPPVLTDDGWLMLYHGVEQVGTVGVYRTFWALLDRDDPTRILKVADDKAVLEAHEGLTERLAHQLYLPSKVVFTTGLVDSGADHWIAASGEADLACRVTHLPKALFA